MSANDKETVYFEREHQELFYLDSALHNPIDVHIPSALGTLPYFVCVRVAEADAAAFDGVTVSLKVGGLRPDDLTLKRGEGVTIPAKMASHMHGHCWLLLCLARVSRGDGVLRFSGLPARIARAHVLLCTWPRFIASGQADDYIACQADSHWAPGGVPLGGIGCGKVELCRDGRFRNFTGNNNQDMPFEDPAGLAGAFLSVRAGGREYALTTRPVEGVSPVRSLHATLAFPQAILASPSVFPGVDVRVTASGPIVPHDLALSSLPGVLLRWSATNTSAAPLDISFRLSWPNLVGSGGGVHRAESKTGEADGDYRFWEAPANPLAATVDDGQFGGLRYANAPSSVCRAADGIHWVLARRDHGRVNVLRDVRRGAIEITLTVPAGGSAVADIVLVWEMPHWIDTLGVDRGHAWQNQYADGREIARDLLLNADRIIEGGAALRALLMDTDLPDWMQLRLINCCYPLVTNSVLYKDGRFSINEGPTEMVGCYGTLDQRLGAHPATQLLFPELNRRELTQFGAYQAASGALNHDFGGGNLERGPSDSMWPDLTCSFILQTARHAWSTGDVAFERDMWPRVRRALLRHKTWADEGEGVAQVGGGLGTSYDGYHYIGTTPYMATLWIASLQVAGRWAQRAGDGEIAAMVPGLIARARARMEADLWNGRYYRAYGSQGGPTNDSCHAGMLAGECYARALAGSDVVPRERLDACADAWFALNGNPRFAVPPDEVSADLQSFTEFGWLPYVECFGLAALAVAGREEVLAVWQRMVRAMQCNDKHPCDTRLMYRPVGGGQSWGSYYMTAPASWLVYDALLDFRYEPGEGILRLAPQIQGAFAVVHPLFWASGQRDGNSMRLEVRRVTADKPIAVRRLETPAAVKSLRCSGTECARVDADAIYARFDCGALPLLPGAVIEWQLDPA